MEHLLQGPDIGQDVWHNEEMPVPAASTVKVPVVLYAASLVGKLSWNERLTYESWRDWKAAGPVLFSSRPKMATHSPFGAAEKAIRKR